MLALAVALCVFGFWACSVVVRRMHLPGLLIVQAVALLLSFGVLSVIGPGGALDPGEMHGVVWSAVIINGTGVALWFAFPRPTRKDDAQDESLD